MRRVRRSTKPDQPIHVPSRPMAAKQLAIPLDDGTTMLAVIQELIPLGLKAVAEALTQEVAGLAGPRYQRGDELLDSRFSMLLPVISGC